MDYIGYIVAGVVLLLGIVLLVCGYLKAPPDTAYIISGFRKRRILIGKAGWRIPFFERVDRISLRVMQVDVIPAAGAILRASSPLNCGTK